jgi:hypothetical protein
LSEVGVVLHEDEANARALEEFVAQYDPQAIALARYLALELPEI